ncbi:serine hydrolase [Hyphococcus flavus]|uniref:Serine hydrolase n=1 Tax=Hyphococcus flavus TaxID=1866326 RepID=A0AAE9ZHZ1_9PROT|nr:serine hydrolase domain-containing protein [Hyphococcus flavus]WDI32962.1 serine hydrolase [Hyphococcus flavus]
MKKILFSLATVLLLTACGVEAERGSVKSGKCVPPQESPDPSLTAKIDPLINDAADRGFAGGVTVMRDGVIVYSRTVGSASLSENIPITDSTLFQVSSIAKYFTAALVLKAAEDGKFTIDDSIEMYAPGTRLATRGVTYADLMAHKSGLGASYVAEATTDPDEAASAIDAADIDEEKVGQFKYSNDGYDLLGILLERAYVSPYEALLAEEIFASACLSNASHWALVDVTDPHIVSQPLDGFPDSLLARNYGMLSTAGLLITAQELAVYQHALVQGGILSPASLEALFAPHGDTSIGKATFGAFLSEIDGLGRRLSARGAESWGDNAIMNHYMDMDVIVTVVTSRGPAEDSGQPLFRNELSEAIEALLFR